MVTIGNNHAKKTRDGTAGFTLLYYALKQNPVHKVVNEASALISALIRLVLLKSVHNSTTIRR
jgi:hypothetical protein